LMSIVVIIGVLIDVGIVFAVIYPFINDNPVEIWIEYMIYLFSL